MSKAKTERHCPYSPPTLRLKVVAASAQREFDASDGTKAKLIHAAVCDMTRAQKATVYGYKNIATIEAAANGQASVMVKNYTVRSDDTLALRQNAVIFRTAPIDVPAALITEAKQLIFPESPVMTIKDILSSPPKSMRTVKGDIVTDEAPKEVTVAGRPASVRNLQVKDTTGRVKVALWRDLANSPCKPGDYVAITHAVLKTFNNEVVLQTTQHTKVELADAPEVTKVVTIVGYTTDELNVTLCEEDGTEYACQKELLRCVVGDDDVEDALCTFLPLNLMLTMHGAEVTQVARELA